MNRASGRNDGKLSTIISCYKESLFSYSCVVVFSVTLPQSLLCDVELEVQSREGTLFLTGEVTAARCAACITQLIHHTANLL